MRDNYHGYKPVRGTKQIERKERPKPILRGVPKKAKLWVLITCSIPRSHLLVIKRRAPSRPQHNLTNKSSRLSRSEFEFEHLYENLPKLKAGLHSLPQVDADLPEVNLEANSDAISSEIRMTYYKKYIEGNEPEDNVALKLKRAYNEKYLREEDARNQLLVGDRGSKNQPIRAKHCQTSIRQNRLLQQ